MLPAALAHVPGDAPAPTWTSAVTLGLAIALGVGIVVLLNRLFKGPLGASNARRFGLLAVMVVAALGVLVLVDRALPH